ncbi:LytTR family DNA-binding domain-containing protein [Roseivirga sp. E12]|uniref:LytR/AlgR family response regulator transcription factor n=1 Tax=Roseivirga sp. E12 TaxID=2819237 RepID=UPI001ABCE33C|nr:LytTR family DNA-binding domain-containing protein [Roseivirga sp. E12]MBO3700237.1 response regulator transcription factor [Roseivirga sp. E12]
MNDFHYKVLIVDDEPLAQDSIKILLEKVKDCNIVGIASNGKDALNQILTLEPHIVFMDIQMPHLLGTEVVEQLSHQANTYFIFVTAFDDQAVKAFELNALDYLLKPYTDQRFYQSLNKAKAHCRSNGVVRSLGDLNSINQVPQRKYRTEFAIKSVGKIEIVPLSDVIYLVSSGNYIEVNTTDRKYLMRGTIGQLEKGLDPELFVRIHRSSIVRKTEIKELQNYFNGEYLVILKNGHQLKLSRSYKSALKMIVSLD